MPRIYKSVKPTENKAVDPVRETKAPKPKNTEKSENKENKDGGQ